MGEKIVVGPVGRGLRNDVTPFNIDDDSFPVLTNAYQWRGRIKRKRGTSLLGRLTRTIETTSIGNSGASPWTFNLYASVTPAITAEPNASIVPGSVQVFINPTSVTGSIVAPGYTNASSCEVFTTPTGLSNGDQVNITGVNVKPGTGPDTINGGPYFIEVLPSSFKIGVDSHTWGQWLSGGTWSKTSGNIVFVDQGDGTLTSTTPGNSGTIDYLTGDVTLTHTAGAGIATDITFSYYPNLPVMGLEELTLSTMQFPGTIAFDTIYSYNINTNSPFQIYNVNYYKNPVADASTMPGYVAKTTETETTWNGQDYQQFWTVNYQGALWTTNGITIPFSNANMAMQYAAPGTTPALTGATRTSATTMQFTVVGNPLVVGDFVFVNEFTASAGGNATTLNYQTGYVTTAGNTFTVTFPFANITAGTYTPGMVQYLTNRSDTSKDCLRWYDGDPINSANGWVNFCPPLNNLVLFPNFSIADLPPAQYYLVGARMIVPFKDRLLFIGPVIQTSDINSQRYLQDTVIYSQNGTPYYTASFQGDPSLSSTIFNPLLVPDNQTASPPSYWEDLTGFGGFITAGVDQAINTVSSNEDVLIMGFDKLQARFVYSGNDIVPFNFFIINSELGSGSTFSIINMDEGAISRGTRGWIITSQVETKRIDLSIPDEIFQLNLSQNGTERFTAQRDFINEWIYFTFPSNSISTKFPNTTLQFNYRDNSWARYVESYTTYGQFKITSGNTWATIGDVYETWAEWNDPWSAGATTILQPKVIAGNQQGFVLFRDEGTGEGNSLYISNISTPTVTSPDHGLNNGDYIIISNVLGTIGTNVNGKIFSVANASNDTFDLNPPPATGTYLGAGLIKRMYVPFIQTKQFPVAWGMSRKVRIGVQQYLFTTTEAGQITLLIFLSQNADSPYNDSSIDLNSGLIYSTLVYTCPESTNLGLTPANINLQIPTAIQQAQTWHRMNTSLLGDTVQLGITLNDTQMRDTDFKSQFSEIEIHGFILDVTPSQVLV